MNDKEKTEFNKAVEKLPDSQKSNFFRKEDIIQIFTNKKIGNTDFNIDFICDRDNCIYKKTKKDYLQLKYNKSNGDVNNEIIRVFCSYFKEGAVDLSAENSIYKYYRHNGYKEYLKLKPVPKLSVVFNDKLIYLGNNFVYDGNLDSIFNYTDSEYLKEKSIETNILENPVEHYFIKNAIYCDYNPDVDINKFPTIYRIIKEWLVLNKNWDNPNEEDLKNINTFFEMVGYCMLPFLPEPKVFLFTGEGNNGKSQAIHLIEKVIEGRKISDNEDGDYRNIYSSTFSALDKNNHESANLKDKTLLVISETNNGYIPSATIKRITGGDSIRGDPKYKQAINFVAICKMIIATNVTPKTDDFTEGHMRRYVFLDFNNNFDEITAHKKVNNIIDTISQGEIEAFTNFCLIKLKELIKNKYKLSNEKSILEKTNRFKEKLGDIEYYIDQKLIITEIDKEDHPDDWVICADMKADFTKWYMQNHIGAKQMPSKIWTEGLKKLKNLNVISEPEQKKVDGKNTRVYYGIKWKNPPEQEEESKQTLLNNTNESNPLIKQDLNNKEKYTEKPKEEYTKQEIFDYFVSKGKITKIYDVDKGIKILKDNNIIYEPIDGVYKLLNKGLQNE